MRHKIEGHRACPPKPELKQFLTGLLRGTLGIGAVAWLTQPAGVPLLMAPFGAT